GAALRTPGALRLVSRVEHGPRCSNTAPMTLMYAELCPLRATPSLRPQDSGRSIPELLREPSEKGIGNNFKASRSQLNRRTSGSTPKTLSEWLTQQKRDGGHY